MERIIGYEFNDRQLAVESLFHGGVPIHYRGDWTAVQRNDRLAILGDILLDAVLASKWLNSQHHTGK